MSEKTILVIDDSLTIRRLADRELTQAGYRVILAETAELGLEKAKQHSPDLILLDHQLPGTTGQLVCARLLQDESLRHIPVVLSSTLRKKAYVEYTECPNVVDMLPKPYTGDLLRTTVANALDTASMIVQSQSMGTAVPEVIDSARDADLAGSFELFSPRELIDFLNNSSKHGALELDFDSSRVVVYVQNGRIQAITASGFDATEVAKALPAALTDLGPMLKFTLSGRHSSQLDGLVELLDNKVLDARLLRQLLRLQAAWLLGRCFVSPPKSFRFDGRHSPPALLTQLPLDVSVAALLVDASLMGLVHPEHACEREYARKAVRGQNLDRAGLSGTHMKLLSSLNRPMTANELAVAASCHPAEAEAVMRAFELADWVCGQARGLQHHMIFVCGDAERGQIANQFLQRHSPSIVGRVVRDALTVRLLSRRMKPDFVLIDLQSLDDIALGSEIRTQLAGQIGSPEWIGVGELGSSQTDKFWSDVIPWDRLDVDLSQRLNLSGSVSHGERTLPELANCN